MSVSTKAESLNQTITDAVATLAAETDAVKQDAAFRTWLASMSRFYNYSSAISFSPPHSIPRPPELQDSNGGAPWDGS